MIAKLKNLFHKYYEIISYVFFGGLTTVVSWIFYYLPLFLGVDYRISKVISWVAAVVFAFFVNKHWVFLDKDYSARALLRQGGEFFASRIATGVVEFRTHSLPRRSRENQRQNRADSGCCHHHYS